MSEQSAHPNAVTGSIMVALIESKLLFTGNSNEENAKAMADMYKTIYAAVSKPSG